MLLYFMLFQIIFFRTASAGSVAFQQAGQAVPPEFRLQYALYPGELPVHTAVEAGVPGAVIVLFHTLDHEERVFEGRDHIIKSQLAAVCFQTISAFRPAFDLQYVCCFEFLSTLYMKGDGIPWRSEIAAAESVPSLLSSSIILTAYSTSFIISISSTFP